MAGFGAGLGQLIGGAMANEDLERGTSSVNRTAEGFNSVTTPYNSFGSSFLPKASGAIDKINSEAGTSMGYDDFMKSYSASPGAEYVKGQALEAQNESAAAKGQLLSGTNLRALTGIGEGISNTFANQAYDQYLKGENQQFGQLETALGNMFGAIGVGTTATGQQAGVANSQMTQQSSLAQAQAKNDASKGSGIGSMFGGLGPLSF